MFQLSERVNPKYIASRQYALVTIQSMDVYPIIELGPGWQIGIGECRQCFSQTALYFIYFFARFVRSNPYTEFIVEINHEHCRPMLN